MSAFRSGHQLFDEVVIQAGMAPIRALAPNYFKYKMFCNGPLPDGLDIGLNPFFPNAGTMEAMEMSGGIPNPSLGPSGHVDDFARRNLPPSEQWPELVLDR